MQELETINGGHAAKLAHAYLFKVVGIETSRRDDESGTTYYNGTTLIGVLEGDGMTIVDGDVKTVTLQEMQDALPDAHKGSKSFHMDQKEYDSLKAMAEEYALERETTEVSPGKFVPVRTESMNCNDPKMEPLSIYAATSILERLVPAKLDALIQDVKDAENYVRKNLNGRKHSKYYSAALKVQGKKAGQALARAFDFGNRTCENFEQIIPVAEAAKIFDSMPMSKLGPFVQQVYALEHAALSYGYKTVELGYHEYRDAALKSLQSR